VSTDHARPAGLSIQSALEKMRDGLRLVADGLHEASLVDHQPGPRLVQQPAREPEVLLTVPQAQELLGMCSRSHVERLIKGRPCRRKAGRLVLVERAGLLALTRRG
jgi:hypothetical protein